MVSIVKFAGPTFAAQAFLLSAYHSAGAETLVAHRLPAVLERPGLRRTLGDRLHDDGEIEAGVLCEVDRLGERLQHAGDGDLVDHLGELARA